MNSYYFIVVVILWTMDHFFYFLFYFIFYVGDVQYMEISGWYLLVSGHWYVIPEETAAGRQPHNLRTELYRTNDFADIEVIFLFYL